MPKIRPWWRMAAVAEAVADDDGARAAALVRVCRRRTGREAAVGSIWRWRRLVRKRPEVREAVGGPGKEENGAATASRRRKRRRRRRKRPSVVNMVKRERSSTATIAASERLLRSRKWRRSTRQSLRENQGDVDRFLAAVDGDGDGENGRREREQGRKVVKDGYGVGKEIKGRDLGGRRTEAKEEKRGGGLRSWRERDGVDTSGGGWRYGRGRRGFRQGSKQRRRRNGGGAGARKVINDGEEPGPMVGKKLVAWHRLTMIRKVTEGKTEGEEKRMAKRVEG